MAKRILSGIQPSGKLHLGNYFGAISQFVDYQNQGDECFYFIADYHAMTTVKDPAMLREYVNEVALTYLAFGIDPEKVAFYRQSDVPEVTELSWIFSCLIPNGLLERCVSYKDKIAQGLTPNHGLFYYPCLQAADILITGCDIVPVGQDQKQHVEVTRDIAEKFNNQYGEVLTIPEPRIRESTAIVPGVDGRKMSKSYDNTIPLIEAAGKCKKRIMKVVTDSTPVEDPKDPEKCNVFALLKLFCNETELAEWRDRYTSGGMGYGEAKKALAEMVNNFLEPARARYEELVNDMSYVEDVLSDGARKAHVTTDALMEKVRSATGLRK